MNDLKIIINVLPYHTFHVGYRGLSTEDDNPFIGFLLYRLVFLFHVRSPFKMRAMMLLWKTSLHFPQQKEYAPERHASHLGLVNQLLGKTDLQQRHSQCPSGIGI